MSQRHIPEPVDDGDYAAAIRAAHAILDAVVVRFEFPLTKTESDTLIGHVGTASDLLALSKKLYQICALRAGGPA